MIWNVPKKFVYEINHRKQVSLLQERAEKVREPVQNSPLANAEVILNEFHYLDWLIPWAHQYE